MLQQILPYSTSQMRSHASTWHYLLPRRHGLEPTFTPVYLYLYGSLWPRVRVCFLRRLGHSIFPYVFSYDLHLATISAGLFGPVNLQKN